MSESGKILEKLDELIFWTKFSVLPSFKAVIENVLRNETEKIVYELSDGNRSTREISRIISRTGQSITHVTITNLWQKWYLMNLVIPVKRKGRFKRVLSLESVGIEVPQFT